MANGQTTGGSQEPDESVIRQHLELLIAPAIGTALQDGLIEIAYGQSRPDKARLFELIDLDLIIEFAARVNRAGHQTWVGAALRRPDWARNKRGNKTAFYGSHFTWIDEPTGWPASSRTVADCPPDVIVTTGKIPGPPKVQLLWRVRDAITDPEALEAINRGIQGKLHGDDVWNRDRLLRVSGSINWPTKPGRTTPELVTFRWHNGAASLTDFDELQRAYGAVSQSQSPRQTSSAGARNILGQIDLGKAIAEAAKPGKWHSTVRDVVAHLVGRHAPDDIIQAICRNFTQPGYTDEQTADEVGKMLAGARRKWGDATFDVIDQPRAEQPLPLTRETPPATPFPLDALGTVLAEAALGIQDIIQTPVAMAGQSVLGAAALAAQAHVDVTLPTEQVRPVSLYFLSVATSGDRKSACDREALRPVRQHERNLRLQFDKQLIGWRDRMDLWKAERDKILKSKSPMLTKQAELNTLGPQPERPLDPVVLTAEPTVEGLVKLLARGQPSVGLFSAEGGQFIGSFAMAKEQRLRTATFYSEAWDGEVLRRIRASEDTLILAGRRVSAHLMVQPNVAALLLGDQMLIEQGLLSRVLISAPESIAGTRFWRDPQPESDIALSRYTAALMVLFDDPPPLTPGTVNELDPRALVMSTKARGLWIGFADEAERQMAPGGSYESIRGVANKAAENAARIAAVLTLIDHPKTGEIAAERMEAGIELARYYLGEALRLLGAAEDDPALLLAQRTLEWLRRQPSPISLRDVYRGGPAAIRSAKTAGKIMALLEEHGHVRREPNQTVWTVVS